MCTFIDIESVAMNALIEVSKTPQKRELSFEDVVCYGKKAARVFRQRTGNDTVLLFSKEYQASMMECCAEYLEVDAYIDRGVFQLKAGASMAEIEDFFRWPLETGLLDALMSPDAVGVLEG